MNTPITKDEILNRVWDRIDEMAVVYRNESGYPTTDANDCPFFTTLNNVTEDLASILNTQY